MRNKRPTISELMTRAGGVEPAGRRGRGGFTLMEIMVAIGAMALLAVGLAAIFDSVGKTVTGGRRVSVLTTYSSLMEDQLRRDFAAITRDGPFLIRQQWCDAQFDPATGDVNDRQPDGKFHPNEDRIPVSSEDPNPRPRRIDELVFFVRGEYATVRAPLHPEVVAKSDVARIYYGHGQRLAPDYSTPPDQNPFLRPEVDHGRVTQQMLEDTRLGVAVPGVENPNAYAGEWTLLRHATLLRPPQTSDAWLPRRNAPGVLNPVPTTGLDALAMADKDAQIALQPAASSLFRAAARNYPFQSVLLDTNAPYLRTRDASGRALRPPQFSSGIIDIASTDLREVRSMIVGYMKPPPFDPAFFPLFPKDVDRLAQSGEYLPPSGPADIADPELLPPVGFNAIDVQHAWMSELFPTQSDPLPFPHMASDPQRDTFGTRMRYEPVPPDLFRVNQSVAAAAGSNAARRPMMSRADQLALSASNLIPRCSEFIVEWSFGDLDANDDIVWYGPARFADTNNNGRIDVNTDRLLTRPYPRDAVTGLTDPSGDHTMLIRYPRVRRPLAPAGVDDVANRDPVFDAHPLTARVLYGYYPAGVFGTVLPHNRTCLTTFFGYNLPTFDPAAPWGVRLFPDGANAPAFGPPEHRDSFDRANNQATANSDRDPTNDPEDSRIGAIPWPWPRLVRITMSLSDPREPTREETFQYILAVPDGAASGS